MVGEDAKMGSAIEGCETMSVTDCALRFENTARFQEPSNFSCHLVEITVVSPGIRKILRSSSRLWLEIRCLNSSPVNSATMHLVVRDYRNNSAVRIKPGS
jgi:hypothetical protein